MTDHFSPKEVSCLTAWYPLAATRHRFVAYFGCFTENLPHMADVSDVPCFSSYPHRKRKLRVLCKRFWRFSVLQMHFVSCSRVKLWFFEVAFDRGRLVWEKYVNIPSGKYIYVHKYVYICVYTYLCKMDEYRYNAGLSWKWMSTRIMLACHKNGWVPVWCWLVIKMDERRSYASLS